MSPPDGPNADAVAVRDAATVACLRDGPAGLETLLLRRAATHAFGAGAEVFPGGALDPGDFAAARDRLGRATDERLVFDLACRLAAIREALEEAGLLLGVAAAAQPAATAIADVRDKLNAGRYDARDLAAVLGAALEPTRLIAFDYFCTPPGPPRRFATRFFAAACAADASAACDDAEAESTAWWSPKTALSAAAGGTIKLMPPTRSVLKRLTGFNSVAAALAGLRPRKTGRA